MYVHTCMYVCMHAYTYMCLNTNVHGYIHKYINTYMCWLSHTSFPFCALLTWSLIWLLYVLCRPFTWASVYVRDMQYVCMYTCVYYVYLCICISGLVLDLIAECVWVMHYVCIYVCLYIYIYIYMYVCMCVCMSSLVLIWLLCIPSTCTIYVRYVYTHIHDSSHRYDNQNSCIHLNLQKYMHDSYLGTHD
jgi:hypothetical protein